MESLYDVNAGRMDGWQVGKIAKRNGYGMATNGTHYDDDDVE